MGYRKKETEGERKEEEKGELKRLDETKEKNRRNRKKNESLESERRGSYAKRGREIREHILKQWIRKKTIKGNKI